jgi:hypothetical protein
MFRPPNGTGKPSSVAGSPVYARDGTWHVPQACFPDADRLVSKNIAFPARAAKDSPDVVVVVEEPVEVVEVVDAPVADADVVTGVSEPPHPQSPIASSHRHGHPATA